MLVLKYIRSSCEEVKILKEPEFDEQRHYENKKKCGVTSTLTTKIKCFLNFNKFSFIVTVTSNAFKHGALGLGVKGY
uniref:Uncharacterized protein n=1 Tax=Strongyloides venezuelensis TaxID=75913 RepID=A0A0K0FCA9_STRVS